MECVYKLLYRHYTFVCNINIIDASTTCSCNTSNLKLLTECIEYHTARNKDEKINYFTNTYEEF